MPMKLTLGGREVKNVAVLLEHVNLLDTRNGLHLELLEGGLELGVLTTGTLGLRSHLTTRGTLTACVVPSIRATWKRIRIVQMWFTRSG